MIISSWSLTTLTDSWKTHQCGENPRPQLATKKNDQSILCKFNPRRIPGLLTPGERRSTFEVGATLGAPLCVCSGRGPLKDNSRRSQYIRSHTAKHMCGALLHLVETAVAAAALSKDATVSPAHVLLR